MINTVFLVFSENIETFADEDFYYKIFEKAFASKEAAEKYIDLKVTEWCMPREHYTIEESVLEE